ncbi:ester cyclase [Streptomyces sp. L7]
MTFVQLIDLQDQSVRRDEPTDGHLGRTDQSGKRTAAHSVIGKDRSDASHFVEIVEFPSYEEAMRNSKLPETDRIFREMVALCDGDADVHRSGRGAGRGAVRGQRTGVLRDGRRAGRTAAAGRSGPPRTITTTIPRNEQDTGGDGPAAGRGRGGGAAASTWRSRSRTRSPRATGWPPRWTWNGTHTGDFMGIPASGRKVGMTGTTTFRCRDDGKIAEGWWQYDRLGLMAQLGALDALER